MASIEAVHRRRQSRAAQSEIDRRRREEREKRQAKVAQKMVTRFYGSMPPHLMMLGYMYWQARRCGWDALHPQWARDADGQPCDPAEGVAWQFWKALHYRQREHLVILSGLKYRLFSTKRRR